MGQPLLSKTTPFDSIAEFRSLTRKSAEAATDRNTAHMANRAPPYPANLQPCLVCFPVRQVLSLIRSAFIEEAKPSVAVFPETSPERLDEHVFPGSAIHRRDGSPVCRLPCSPPGHSPQTPRY